MTDEEMKALLEETATNISVAAAQVARRYRGFVTYADLRQEGNIWVLKHPATVKARLTDGKRGDFRLTNQIAKHLDKLARREKAATSRYQPEDEAFYLRTVIEAALPAIWDDEYLLHPPNDDTPTEPHRRHPDPAEGNNWLVTVIDVRTAWANCDMDERSRVALAYRYGEGLKVFQIAELMECAESTVYTLMQRGIRCLIIELGGDPPGRCPPDCECGEGPGTRRAISNAEARARTDHDWQED